jgi:hypothetical protein
MMKNKYGSTAIPYRAWAAVLRGRCGAVYLGSILLLLGCLLSGCTTLKPIDVDAVTLHQKIRSGEVVKAGDTIRAITNDGVAHKLTVTAVNGNVVKGRSPYAGLDAAITELAIDDIVRMEVREYSGEKVGTFTKETGKGGLGTLAVVLIIAVIGLLISGP